jgi:hypothetical protein
MKHISRMASLIFVALLLTACAEPKLDGSSPEMLQNSAKIIMEDLPEEMKEKFKETFTWVSMAIRFTNMDNGKTREESRAMLSAELDGKTADDIFVMAKELEEKMQKKVAN